MKKKLKIKEIKIGDILYTCGGNKNHILGFVFDGDEKLVVYKSWLKQRACWRYYTEYFDVFLDDISMKYGLTEDEETELFKVNNCDINYIKNI